MADNRLLYSTIHAPDEFLARFKPVVLKQVHSDIIVDVDREPAGVGDGLTTARKNVGLGIKAADCLPVYLFSAGRICVIHCGWRSIIKGIPRRAARLMGDFSYVLGACIGPCCYEIRDDVAELFARDLEPALDRRRGKIFLDLKKCLTMILGEEKFAASLDYCVKCHPELFFSNRGGDKGKRNYAVIVKEA
jgi:hypothetical protein